MFKDCGAGDLQATSTDQSSTESIKQHLTALKQFSEAELYAAYSGIGDEDDAMEEQGKESSDDSE